MSNRITARCLVVDQRIAEEAAPRAVELNPRLSIGAKTETGIVINVELDPPPPSAYLRGVVYNYKEATKSFDEDHTERFAKELATFENTYGMIKSREVCSAIGVELDFAYDAETAEYVAVTDVELEMSV